MLRQLLPYVNVRLRFTNVTRRTGMTVGAHNQVATGDMVYPCRKRDVLIRTSNAPKRPAPEALATAEQQRKWRRRVESHRQRWRHELKTAILFGWQGIGPPVYYHTNRHMITVMEKYDMDLGMYIYEHVQMHHDYRYLPPQAARQLLRLIQRAAIRRYILLDLKPNNVVVKLDVTDPATVTDMRLIDFDCSWAKRPSAISLGPGYAVTVRHVYELWMLVLMAAHLSTYFRTGSPLIRQRIEHLWGLVGHLAIAHYFLTVAPAIRIIKTYFQLEDTQMDPDNPDLFWVSMVDVIRHDGLMPGDCIPQLRWV